jgi:hypothetical protein
MKRGRNAAPVSGARAQAESLGLAGNEQGDEIRTRTGPVPALIRVSRPHQYDGADWRVTMSK